MRLIGVHYLLFGCGTDNPPGNHSRWQADGTGQNYKSAAEVAARTNFMVEQKPVHRVLRRWLGVIQRVVYPVFIGIIGPQVGCDGAGLFIRRSGRSGNLLCQLFNPDRQIRRQLGIGGVIYCSIPV